MPSPSSPVPNPHNPNRAAKLLLRDLRAGDPDSIRRVRAVYHHLKDVSDADVPQRMSLMRCQHVVSKELGATTWTDLKDSRTFQVLGVIGHADIEALRVASIREPAGSRIREMMSDLFDPTKGYRAIGTRVECESLIEWSCRVLPKERRTPPRTVAIAGKTTTIDLGGLRMEPLGPPEDDPIDADFEYLSESDD
jgi:hypothetical protein